MSPYVGLSDGIDFANNLQHYHHCFFLNSDVVSSFVFCTCLRQTIGESLAHSCCGTHYAACPPPPPPPPPLPSIAAGHARVAVEKRGAKVEQGRKRKVFLFVSGSRRAFPVEGGETENGKRCCFHFVPPLFPFPPSLVVAVSRVENVKGGEEGWDGRSLF